MGFPRDEAIYMTGRCRVWDIEGEQIESWAEQQILEYRPGSAAVMKTRIGMTKESERMLRTAREVTAMLWAEGR
jgi:hypothetical protein